MASKVIVKNPYTGKVYGEPGVKYSREMSQAERTESLEVHRSSGKQSAYQAEQEQKVLNQTDKEEAARLLVEKQVQESGPLVKETAEQKAQEEAYIKNVQNQEEIARYISAKSKANKERELQARATLQKYYKSVLEGKNEDQARHRLESVFSYSQYGINKQLRKDLTPPPREETAEQRKEMEQTIKTYGTARTVFALSETNRQAQLKRAAIEKQYQANLSAGMSEEEAKYKRDSLLSYEASKDVEFYNQKLQTGLFGGGSSGGKGAGGTWFSNEEWKNANWLERWDMKMKEEAGLTGDLNTENKSWPRYIFAPQKGQAQGVTPKEAYLEFKHNLKQFTDNKENLRYLNPFNAVMASNKASAFVYRTVQDQYSRLKNEPLEVEKELLISYFGGVVLGGIGGYVMAKGGPLAITAFKGLSYAGAGGYAALTGAKYITYEAGLSGAADWQRATAPNAPNLIQDLGNLAAFSVGMSNVTKGVKYEQKQKQPLKTTTRKLESEVVENYPRQTITQRQKSTGRIEVKMEELGFTQRQKSTGRIEVKMEELGFKQAEIKQFLHSKAYVKGEPVTITSYKPVQGNKAIGGIERGYFVKAGENTYGFYVVKGKYRVIVDINPSTTTLRYRSLKTGKLLDFKTVKTMESGLDLVSTTGTKTVKFQISTYKYALDKGQPVSIYKRSVVRGLPNNTEKVYIKIGNKYKPINVPKAELTSAKNYGRDFVENLTKSTRKNVYIDKSVSVKANFDNPQYFKYQKELFNKPGIRATYRAEATQSLYTKRFKTDVKPITTTREELSFIKGLKSGQLTTTQPTYTTQRTGEVTEEGIKFTGKKTIIDQAPKIKYGNEKLLPERYTAQVTKGGDVFFEKVKPGKVYGQVVYKQFGEGKGLIAETVQGSKPVDVFFKMVKSKAGALPVSSQILQHQLITVQAHQLEAPSSQFQTIPTSILKEMPRTELKLTPLLISKAEQRQELKPQLKLFTPQITSLQQLHKTDTISKVDFIQEMELILKTEQRVRTSQKLEQVQEVIIEPEVNIFRPRVPRVPETKVPPIEAPFKFKKEEPQKKGGMFFKVLVRRKGQFKVIATARTEQAAINIGKTRVLGTAAASFKIEPNPTRSIVPNKIFYGSKREPGVFIQRRSFRISSPGEKREIPGKAAFLSRTKRAVRNIFGGL